MVEPLQSRSETAPARQRLLGAAITRLQVRSRSTARWFVPRTHLGCTVHNTLVRVMLRPLLTRYFRKALIVELALADVSGT